MGIRISVSEFLSIISGKQTTPAKFGKRADMTVYEDVSDTMGGNEVIP
jgi:hypothetical protein